MRTVDFFILCWGLFSFAAVQTSTAQAMGDSVAATDIETRIANHFQAGELPAAIELAKQLPAKSADPWMSKIAMAQLNTDSKRSAFQSAGLIRDDRARSILLASMATRLSSQSDQSTTENQPESLGNQGGVTADDFTPLVDLITGNIATDTWRETGQGEGSIQPFPSGVFVDASGTMRRLKHDPNQSAAEVHKTILSDSGNRLSQSPSPLRTISLTRLERESQLLFAQGLPFTDAMRNLAGLTEIKYVMAFPETQEIVIAGPAGPWKKDQQNRSVNIESGQPVLQLDDLVVCLRNAWENNGKFGCAITPRQQNLADTQTFLATTSLKGKRWSQELRKKLGQQDIEVFGIDSRTHAARILVEADYRMKLVGMGIEPSIDGVASFLDRVEIAPDGSLPPMDVVRWWFTLNYDDVFADKDRLAFSFSGTGVKVLSENEMLADDGQRIHTNQTHGPAKSFANDFTEHFAAIAKEYPIYRELKNVFDMAIVASLIRHQRLAEKSSWHLTFFGPETSNQLAFPLQEDVAAAQVDSVMNERVIKVRKRSSTIRHTIVGVSGGISFNAHDAISKEKLKPITGDESDQDTVMHDAIKKLEIAADKTVWWWD